jgi:hypothetical protein
MKRIKHTPKILALLILLGLYMPSVHAQITWPKDPKMVNAVVTPNGDLVITPSATSSQDDFNFLPGKWVMDNKRLKTRLNNCTEWIEFQSKVDNLGMVLYGVGNIDIVTSKFNPVNDKPYQGMTVRLFNPKTKLWSLYWCDSVGGAMDPPVVGSFEGNIGRFYCKDTFNGKPILVMFQWDKTDKENPVWSQAFSPDNGVTWEMNFTNTSHRVK